MYVQSRGLAEVNGKITHGEKFGCPCTTSYHRFYVIKRFTCKLGSEQFAAKRYCAVTRAVNYYCHRHAIHSSQAECVVCVN